MGGNALKAIETRRYSKEEYENYFKKISHDFLDMFEFHSIRLIPAYSSKDSFGDMDLIFSTNVADPYSEIIEYYNLDKDRYVKNGDVFSFAPDDFQIDLIRTEKDYIGSAWCYFAYNDLSNLLGRLTHKLGIKLGHKGLSMVIRSPNDDSNVLGEIELSNRYADALDILGLSVERYSRGFDTLEDIFEYVASSKFFNGDVFLLDNRNNISRTRDRKRPTYSKFLEWIQNVQPKNNYIFAEKREGGHGIREPYFSDIILKMYPSVKQKIIELIEADLVKRNFKRYFNGEIVRELSGFKENWQLGALMGRIQFSQLERRMINEDMVKAKVNVALREMSLSKNEHN